MSPISGRKTGPTSMPRLVQTWYWSNVAKAAAGTYSVVVTASNGGQAEASAEVKVVDLPELSAE